MISQNSSGFKSLLTCSYCFFFFSPPSLKILRKLKKDILAAAEGWGGRRCPLSPPGPPGEGSDAGRDSHAETKVLASPGKRRHRWALRGDNTPRCPVPGRARRCSPRRVRRSLLGRAGHHRGSNKCQAPFSGRAAEPEEGSRLHWEGAAAPRRAAVTSRLAGRGGCREGRRLPRSRFPAGVLVEGRPGVAQRRKMTLRCRPLSHSLAPSPCRGAGPGRLRFLRGGTGGTPAPFALAPARRRRVRPALPPLFPRSRNRLAPLLPLRHRRTRSSARPHRSPFPPRVRTRRTGSTRATLPRQRLGPGTGGGRGGACPAHVTRPRRPQPIGARGGSGRVSRCRAQDGGSALPPLTSEQDGSTGVGIEDSSLPLSCFPLVRCVPLRERRVAEVPFFL